MQERERLGGVAPSWTTAIRARVIRRGGVLDDVAAIDDAGGALLQERGGALEDLGLGRLAAAAHEDGDAARRSRSPCGRRHVVGGVGLDDVGAELHGLADERDDLRGSPSTM
jgi:hypothetical protein